MDKIAVVIEQDASRVRSCTDSLSQEEANHIERRLQGGPDSDLESDVDDGTDDESNEERVPLSYTLRPFSDSNDSVMVALQMGDCSIPLLSHRCYC